MDNPLATFYRWQVSSGALDGWTSYHIAAGLFIAKVAQWLGATDFWAVMWVVIIGIAWEIFEVNEETMGYQYSIRPIRRDRSCMVDGNMTELIYFILILVGLMGWISHFHPWNR